MGNKPAMPRIFCLMATIAALSACASPTTPASDERELSTEEQDAIAVENAIRQAYEQAKAEVLSVDMVLSPDGSRYLGQAVVRNPENGVEITVDCRFTTDVTGAPDLNCERAGE